MGVVNDLPAQRQVGAAQGNLVLDLFVLNQRIGALLDAALAPTGVRPTEYAVYSQLGLGAMTPSLLCERLGVSRSTMTGILATLQRRGDTERLPDPADRRSYRVALTESGLARLEDCRPRFRTALRRLGRNLDADPEEVRRLLARVDRAAERATSELALPPGALRGAT
jgi:DNA-binding MarR family transcriptional regulator